MQSICIEALSFGEGLGEAKANAKGKKSYRTPIILRNLPTMNRIDRVSAILIQLQSRRVVKASDIAERFGISLRTVYRDVNTLVEAGIPIIGEAGVGYSIVD